jgi:hypothetical protein
MDYNTVFSGVDLLAFCNYCALFALPKNLDPATLENIYETDAQGGQKALPFSSEKRLLRVMQSCNGPLQSLRYTISTMNKTIIGLLLIVQTQRQATKNRSNWIVQAREAMHPNAVPTAPIGSRDGVLIYIMCAWLQVMT